MWLRAASRVLVLGLCCAIGLAACGRRDETPPAAPEPAAPRAAAAPAAPAVAAARAPAGLRVESIELGASVGADRRVTAPSTTFAPGDTVYASVRSEGGAGDVTLSARWTYEDGQLVNESSQTVPGGAAFTEFHIAKPSGWPAGRYRVEILANGTLAGSRDFEVR